MLSWKLLVSTHAKEPLEFSPKRVRARINVPNTEAVDSKAEAVALRFRPRWMIAADAKGRMKSNQGFILDFQGSSYQFQKVGYPLRDVSSSV